jgi:hypothetical protein
LPLGHEAQEEAIEEGVVHSLLAFVHPSLGNQFDILDWGTLNGTFAVIQLPALSGGLSWDTSQLYSSGVLNVVAASLPGDYNGNGIVDAANYVIWRKGLSTPYTQNDFLVWRSHLEQSSAAGISLNGSTVPEPNSQFIAVAVILIIGVTRNR